MKVIGLKGSKIRVYGKTGKLTPKGIPEEHTAFLHNLFTNDIGGMRENSLSYNLWLRQNGFPRGEFFVYRLDGEYFLDTPLEAKSVVEEFNSLKLSMRVYFEPIEMEHLFLFGDGVGEFIKSHFKVSLKECEVVRVGDVLIAHNPFRLREEGYDIMGNGLSLPQAETMSEDEFEDLRIQKMVPKLGKELKEGFSPLEACLLKTAISLTKGCYVGQEAIARVHYRGRLPRVLALVEGQSLVEGEKIRVEDKDIGVITSVSPLRPIALAYLLRAKVEQERSFLTDRGNNIKVLRLCEV
ncbi:MAG: folate-binding protein [Aquificaceae bacterium]|nr:folate-binding protein [Aquificaceae bacterium]